MIIGPKYKICRRLGNDVFGKCQTQKFTLSEERHSKTKKRTGRPKAQSDFGKQLLERQKIRYTYGITEKQLSRYVKEVLGKSGTNSSMELLKRLESRLDNVVYRLGLANTRRMARQIVSHGHIAINDKKMTIPSHQVQKGEKIKVRDRSKEKALFLNMTERLKDQVASPGTSFDVSKMQGEMKSDIMQDNSDLMFDVSSVLEFYSR